MKSLNALIIPRLAAAITILLMAALPLQSATLDWNAGGGDPSGGTGTWDNGVTANWWNGSSSIAWDNANGDTARFGAPVGEVTLGSDIRAAALAMSGLPVGYSIVNSGANSYSLTLTGNGGTNNPITVGMEREFNVNVPVILDTAPNGTSFSIVKSGSGVLGFNQGISVAGATPPDITLRLASNGAIYQLGGVSDYTGTTSMFANGVALRLASDTALGSSVLQLNPTSTGGVILQAVGGTRTIDNNLSFTSHWTNRGLVISGDNDFIFNGNITAQRSYVDVAAGLTATFNGDLTDTGGDKVFRKVGDGTLVLAGTNSYNNGTHVLGGVLEAANNNALGSSTVTVYDGARLQIKTGVSISNAFDLQSGSTLSGNGSVAAALTVGDGVIVAPGNSPGTLTFTEDVTFQAGSIYEWELGAYGTQAGTDSDLLVVSGNGNTMTFDAGALISLNFVDGVADPNSTGDGDFWLSNHQWTIGEVREGATIIDSGLFFSGAYDFENGSFSLGMDGENLVLSFTAIPEPSTVGLMIGAVALAGCLLSRRGRRSC